MSNSIYCDALREALDVIAALPYGDTHEVDEGHEQAYRAIEQHLAKHENITPIIASEADNCSQPDFLADPRVREFTQQAYIEGFEAGLSEGRERLIRPWDAQTPVQAWTTSEAANALRADLAPQDARVATLVEALRAAVKGDEELTVVERPDDNTQRYFHRLGRADAINAAMARFTIALAAFNTTDTDGKPT